MRRSAEDAIHALRTQITDWGRGGAKADLRILAYPPDREADMVRRITHLAKELADDELAIEVADAGLELVAAVESRAGLRDRLVQADTRDPESAYEDLSHVARQALVKLLKRPLPEHHVARIVVNIGALATLVSYSQITSEFFGPNSDLGGPTVLAFPGDADERSLNLLNLRVDTSYRAPRI